jgi:hypothetical protein
LVPLDFSGSCATVTESETPPRKSYWIATLPTIPVTASKNLPSFTAKYGEHMYHPLFFFEAKTSCLLSAQLRPGNASAAAGIAAEFARLVPAEPTRTRVDFSSSRKGN